MTYGSWQKKKTKLQIEAAKMNVLLKLHSSFQVDTNRFIFPLAICIGVITIYMSTSNSPFNPHLDFSVNQNENSVFILVP